MKWWLQLPVALGLGLLSSLSLLVVADAQGQSATLELTSQNNSGVTGMATITDVGGGQMKAEIRATGAGAGPQPAHIHEGTCGQLNPAPKFALAPVVNGASTSEVSSSLQALVATPHAIHLHKSPDELPVYVACADIKMSGQPGMLPSAGEAPSTSGMATLGFGAGLVLVLAGYTLLRRQRAQS